MGGGSWSSVSYAAAATTRSTGGVSDFAYSDSGARTTHIDLDVSKGGLDGKGAIRECRDSDDHPQAFPMAVILDVTGSNIQVARAMVKKLPALMGLLLRKGYVPDPQIMFGAIGDATAGDRAPVQFGQFEADNRLDEDLMKLLLVGGGGGGIQESYELGLYFLARRVSADRWEKHGEKGIVFFIGDEQAYPTVRAAQVREHIGTGTDQLEGDIPLAQVLEEVKKKWDVFFILGSGASHAGDEAILQFWKDLLGEQNVIELADLDAAAETIALTVGLTLGTVSFDDALDDLDDVGAGAVKGTVGRALATIGAASAGGAVVTTAPPGDLDTPSNTERL